jgi:serine/threonine protein kinase
VNIDCFITCLSCRDQQLTRPWHNSRFVEPYIPKLSAECIDLLNKMLVVDPANRISLSALEQHPWMSTALPEDLDSAWVRLLKEQEGAATRANHVKIDKVALQERDDSIWELVNEAASTRTDHVASRKAKWPFEDLTSIPGGWRIDMKLAAVQANE